MFYSSFLFYLAVFLGYLAFSVTFQILLSSDVPCLIAGVKELEELHSALEEAKADIVGLWALRFLIKQVAQFFYYFIYIL